MTFAKTTLLDNSFANANGYSFYTTTCNTEFKGDIIIKGVSLTDTLKDIESRLGILRPNQQIEEEWQELKELGDRYRALEQEINRKMEVWDLLKREE